MGAAIYVWLLGNVAHEWNTPTRWFRNWFVVAGGQQEYNYDGDRTAGQLHAFSGGELLNYWNVAVYTELYPEVNDDRATRGGPVVRRAGGYLLHSRMSTEPRSSC